MEGAMTTISSVHKTVVDVRDVASAHLLAMKSPIAVNRRFILCQGCPTFQEFAAPVAAKYRPLGWPITENLAAPIPNE